MSKMWNSYRIKDIAKVSRGASPRPIQNYLTDDEVNGIPWIKISDATKVKKYIESTEEYIIPSGAGKSNLVLPGDLIVSNSATPGIPRFLKIKACIHDGWLLLRKLKNVKKEFLFYLIESIRSKLKNQGTGSIFINLSIDILANEVVFIPTLEQQTKIANYLDTETSKIDRKISILEQKYEKLEEYKQSVIFETVTKGLDKNVELKDSGIDWIGEIPKHWELKRVKEFVKLSQGLSVNSSEYVDESDVVLIRMGNIKKGGKIDLNHKNVYLPSKFKKSSKQYLLKENDIIIAMTDMSPNLDFLGVPAKLIGLNEDLTYIVNQRVGKLNFKTKDLNIDYFKYYLMTPLAKNQFKAEGLGTIQGNMSDSHFSNLFFVQPSWNEQNNMVTYLNTICSKIDKKVEIIKKQIELLKEYKQTIIYEAVTGKMEIL